MAKRDAYDMAFEAIDAMLEQGVVPWRKPWNAVSNMPRNIHGRPYRGLNVWILAFAPFGSPYWTTYNQAKKKRGGHVRRGEKATTVFLWKPLKVKDETTASGEKTIILFRTFSVFNLEQCEGIEAPETVAPQNPDTTPIQACEAIVAGMPKAPPIRVGGGAAAYSPLHDQVVMPESKHFKNMECYYAALFHELAHATGHESRVGRKAIMEPSGFGSHDYSQEELVAEFSASFLAATAGIERETLQNAAAYIAHWREKLDKDRRVLVYAASQAQKACDWILDAKAAEDEEEKAA